MKLSNDKKIKAELKEFQKKINIIDIEEPKKYGLSLLSSFKKQINYIDEMHSDFSAKDIDAKKIKENVIILNDIRTKIKKLIKDARL